MSKNNAYIYIYAFVDTTIYKSDITMNYDYTIDSNTHRLQSIMHPLFEDLHQYKKIAYKSYIAES